MLPMFTRRCDRAVGGPSRWATRARACAAMLLAALVAGPAHAQPPCGERAEVRAVSVDEGERTVPPAYLNDRIAVELCGLDTLLKAAADAQREIHLFVNGIDAGLSPVAVDRDAQRLVFLLRRTPENRALWMPVFSNPLFERRTLLQLSAGVAGGEPLPGAGGAARTLEFKKLWVDTWTWVSGAALLLVLGLTVWLGQRSDMLRDAPTVDGVRQPYSLARVQMAWWFVLVVAGFITILLVTGDTDTLPASIILLTGISALTGVASVRLTPAAEERMQARRADVERRQTAADASVTGLLGSLETLAAQVEAARAAGRATDTLDGLTARLQKRLAQREREAAELAAQLHEVGPSEASEGFWKDLVSDATGRVALYRLQMVVWTVLLGGLYVQSVLAYVTMPDFSATLLGLMGVSSGTYVGFKLPGAGETPAR